MIPLIYITRLNSKIITLTTRYQNRKTDLALQLSALFLSALSKLVTLSRLWSITFAAALTLMVKRIFRNRLKRPEAMVMDSSFTQCILFQYTTVASLHCLYYQPYKEATLY